MKKHFLVSSCVVAWGICVMLCALRVKGWTTPTENPPEGNIELGGEITAAGEQGGIQYNDNGTFAAHPQFYWDKINKRLGIGTSSPQATLHVSGQVLITGGNPGLGKVLVSNEGGLASWGTVPGLGLCYEYFVKTTKTYNGNLGGVAGGTAKCRLEYPLSNFAGGNVGAPFTTVSVKLNSPHRRNVVSLSDFYVYTAICSTDTRSAWVSSGAAQNTCNSWTASGPYCGLPTYCNRGGATNDACYYRTGDNYACDQKLPILCSIMICL